MSAYGPPCPGCAQLGRRNQSARRDKKYRCVNMACDVLFFSWQESVDAESARRRNEPAPKIESKKQEDLFGNKIA